MRSLTFEQLTMWIAVCRLNRSVIKLRNSPLNKHLLLVTPLLKLVKPYLNGRCQNRAIDVSYAESLSDKALKAVWKLDNRSQSIPALLEGAIKLSRSLLMSKS